MQLKDIPDGALYIHDGIMWLGNQPIAVRNDDGIWGEFGNWWWSEDDAPTDPNTEVELVRIAT